MHVDLGILERPRTTISPPKEGESPKISEKSRLMKYYIMWPDVDGQNDKKKYAVV